MNIYSNHTLISGNTPSFQGKKAPKAIGVLAAATTLFSGCKNYQPTTIDDFTKKYGNEAAKIFKEKDSTVAAHIKQKGLEFISSFNIGVPDSLKPLQMKKFLYDTRTQCLEKTEVQVDSLTKSESSPTLGMGFSGNIMLTSDDVDYNYYKEYNPATILPKVSIITRDISKPAESSSYALKVDCYGKFDHARIDTVKDDGPAIGINTNGDIEFGIGF